MMLSHALETSIARICFLVMPAPVRRLVAFELALRVPKVAESLCERRVRRWSTIE